MSLVHRALAIAAFCFGLGVALPAAHAQQGCVPNPNANGYPFYNGCNVPASGLNAAFLAIAGPSITSFGAVCDGVTDDYVAIQAAFNSGHQVLTWPGATCYSSAQLTLPDDVTIYGLSYRPGGFPPAGSVLQCSKTLSGYCLVVGNADNHPNTITRLSISGGSGSPSSGKCMDVHGGLLVLIRDVECYNFAAGFQTNYFSSNGSGLYITFDNVTTCGISDSHFIVNGTPGVYAYHPIVGCDGTGDVVGNDYVKIIGNWDTTKGTVHFVDPQFNLGTNTVSCAVNFANFTGVTNQFLDFSIVGGHIEATQNFLCSDSSVGSIAQLSINGNSSVGGNGTNHFFSMNAATEPEYWVFSNNNAFSWADYTLAPSAGPSVLVMSGNNFPGLLHITAASGGDAVITSNNYIAGATLDGAGWLVGQFDGTFLGGSASFSDTALSKLNINLQSVACTAGLQIGGSSTGITYSGGTPVCAATLSNGYATVNYELSVTSLGGLSGVATMTGLPFLVAAQAPPLAPVVYANMASLTAPLMTEPNVSAHTVNFVQGGATGLAQISNSNFGSCSGGSPCVVQGIVTYRVAGN